MTLPDPHPPHDAANDGVGESDAAPSGAARRDAATDVGGETGAAHGSGLRDPARAIRGLGALTLMLEGIALLLAILPMRMIAHSVSVLTIVVLLGGFVATIVLAGSLRREISWRLGTALQALLVLGGMVHWMIGVIGITFGLAWIYVLYVRRRVLSTG